MKSYFVIGMVLFGVFGFTNLQAHDLSKPTGTVILTITGNITNTNADGNKAEFDRDMLMNLEVMNQRTMTPWSEGVDLYRGPLLRSVMAAVGAKTDELSVTALNDYSAEVPRKDGEEYDVILAMEMNGKVMSVRDKGPIFLLYPFSDEPNLNNEVIHNRSVWQIKSINVE
ncbi:molybdopterin-dependent oxidoreductase [Marinomonas rhizomae]|uniref:molybdopterin-dependent oxidoreductase n=1 Tax=Marinomonas rhizomae TaxID=491948 RepID=UPI0021064DF8|nr:molybdopterin-dependent oxidoreductase [Marinomonas rhizomae]UTV97819.1 molybdopterin-dependent oxidoreductase [Marinomonas rhizomae]